MIDKYTMITEINKLIQREHENSRIYCELNPGDTENRRRMEHITIAAYLEVSNALRECDRSH